MDADGTVRPLLHFASFIASPDCGLSAYTPLPLLLRTFPWNIPALSIMTGSLFQSCHTQRLIGYKPSYEGQEVIVSCWFQDILCRYIFSVRKGNVGQNLESLKNGASPFFHALLNSRALSLSMGVFFCRTSLFYSAHLHTQTHTQSKTAKLAFNKKKWWLNESRCLKTYMTEFTLIERTSSLSERNEQWQMRLKLTHTQKIQ